MKTLASMMAAVMVFGVAVAAHAQERPRARAVFGTIVKVEGNDVTVDARRRGGETEQVTVTLDENAAINVNGVDGKVADLKPDMQVTIRTTGGRDGGETRTVVTATSPGIDGRVVRVDGTKVVLSVRERGQEEPREVTVTTDSNTKVIFLGYRRRGEEPQEPREGTVAEIEEGMRVHAIPETGTATTLIVGPARRRGGGDGEGGQRRGGGLEV